LIIDDLRRKEEIDGREQRTDDGGPKAEDYNRLMQRKWTAYYTCGKSYAARNEKGKRKEREYRNRDVSGRMKPEHSNLGYFT
jgi:hypothetical protein